MNYLSLFHYGFLLRSYLALSFWNILLCSAVLPDFVSVSTQWVKQAPLPVLTERPHVRDKRSTLPQLLVVSVLAQAAYYIFNGSTSWGCAKTCHCPKKEDLNNYLQAVWKLDPQAASFKSMTERQSRGTTSTHFNPWVVQSPQNRYPCYETWTKSE